ncbi:LOW QUALITY PROTEIN: pentatricopeptide repeat-containing protein At4g38150 [Phoenix dactylifera]|uniref:LOW QUALITY PROTEIN: pentatricopeptide repeat-containing protein At4g38150 n=1 Tax=Phoenix dactylifera TaxID=42345 RepID=A0A8B7CH13_PHODC|nr:LOW QUALITY PROTEIN: pentatricopeptide repeat-containing protein At4g38150 [Phoenix dactylifera]
MRGERGREDSSEDLFRKSLNFGDDGEEERAEKTRPLRGEGRLDEGSKDLFPELKDQDGIMGRGGRAPESRIPNRPLRGVGREDFGHSRWKIGNRGEDYKEFFLGPKSASLFADGPKSEEKNKESTDIGDQSKDSAKIEKGGDKTGDTLFKKLNLGDAGSGGNVEVAPQKKSKQSSGPDSVALESVPEDADEIFRKMKETGLIPLFLFFIPNAVAMLDGLCKDGLIQEAMKLFGLLREKGTVPEVVIYPAVVEGFCKAAKFDDAKRIFRKMQKNGIVPNAFSYAVLIQGLCKGGKLEDSVEFCMEMLDAGHLPNAATFTGLVDGCCKDKGVEEAGSLVRTLRERGFAVDEKAARVHLDKKGPLSPVVWEASFGKNSQRPF